MKKIYSLILAMAMVLTVNAANYFVSVDGAGTHDGTSWENAISGPELFALLYGTEASFEQPSNFYFASGTYYPCTTAGGDLHIKKMYNLYGGYESRTGTDTTTPDYTIAAPTIFSGDLNGNAEADAEDVKIVLHYKLGTEHVDSLVYVRGIDIMYAYGTDGEGYNGGLFMQQTRAIVQNCRIMYNAAMMNGAGGCMVHGGVVHFMDCEFSHNKAGQYGGALRTSNNKGHMATAVLERCLFYDNEVTVNYGGAILQSGGTIYGINSTFYGNKAPNYGAALSLKGVNTSNPNNVSYWVSCTIAGNECTANAEDPTVKIVGSQIRFESNVKVYICNNIIVGKNDKGDDSNPAMAIKGLTDKFSNHFENGTYNTLGFFLIDGNAESGFVNDAADVFTVRDSWGLTTENLPKNTFENTFGSNVLEDRQGFLKALSPLSDIKRGATTVALGPKGAVQTALACPFTVDLLTDMLGNKRAAATTCGALQYTEPSALTSVRSAQQSANKYISNGKFYIEKDGVRYSVLGTQL